MVEKVDIVLEEAKRRLREDPFDAGHDYKHHNEVVINCFYIIRRELIRPCNIDVDALIIAAWWHDYKRNQDEENDRILIETMLGAGFDQDYVKKVLEIKNSHSYGGGQESLESQVLFDSDKLEYLSVVRCKHVSEAVKRGEMSLETLGKYKRAFRERIPHIRGQLHFDSAREIYDFRLKEMIDYQNADPLWSDLFGVL